MTSSTARQPTSLLQALPGRSHLLRLLVVLAAAIGLPNAVQAQNNRNLPNVHYLLDARQPPGEIAAAQAARRLPGFGTYQAVSISGPENLHVALAKDSVFLEPLSAPVTTGMLVGSVYRFRVTQIPLRPGQELYPTIEIIDRICPPAGREHRFPIPVVLTTEDLWSALNGALVTRVIYLEDSEIAEPKAAEPGLQRTTDVGPLDNALKVADQLGRPVAILRIGSRVPANLQADLTGFMYGCPPWIPLPTAPNQQDFVDSGRWPEVVPMDHGEEPYTEAPMENVPRVPLP